MRRLACLCLLAAAACQSTAVPPAAPAPDRGAIAIRVRTVGLGAEGRHAADKVWFTRLPGGADAVAGRVGIASNDARQGVVYLLNVEPGRYAAVSCSYRRDGRDHTTHFPAPLVRETVVTVEAGAVAWAGAFELQRSNGNERDEAQKHYAPKIEPDWDRVGFANALFQRKFYRSGRGYRRTDDDEARQRVRAALAPAGWRLQP